MKNWLKKLKQKATTTASVLNFSDLVNGSEHVRDAHNLNSFKESPYLYIAISKIAKRVAGVSLEMYRIKNKKGSVVEILDHPLLALLNKPNSLQSRREFMEHSVAHYLLAGDCFWLLNREGRSITELIPLRPDYVEIVLSQDRKTVIGYDYRADKVYRFQPEDILHIRNIDPTSPLRGVGVVRPASTRIVTEQEASIYQANFFKNQGRPDFVVMVDGVVDEEDAEESRSKWKRVFGRGNTGNVGFFGNNIKDIKQLTVNPKEMDYIQSQKFLRDDILAILSVPKAMVTSDDVNLANAKEAYRMFIQEAVIPVLEAFVDKINHTLVPMYDQTMFISFTDPSPADEDFKLKRVTSLKRDGIITANEGRAEYDYEAMEGGDTLSHTTGAAIQQAEQLATQAKAILRSRPLAVKQLEATDAVVALLHTNQPKRKLNSIFPDQKSKELYAKAYNKKADRKAEGVQKEVESYLDGMVKRVLDSDLDIHSYMDVPKEKKIASDFFNPIMQKLYTEGGQEALDALYRKSETHFFADAVLLAAIEGRVAFFTASVVDTANEVIKVIILNGVKEGAGIDSIAKEIRTTFEEMKPWKSKQIAQTETNFVLSKATSDAYMQSSVVTGMEWLSVGDDKVRPEHVENNGKIVAKGAAFPSGEHYPAEHSVNCRCVLLPTV